MLVAALLAAEEAKKTVNPILPVMEEIHWAAGSFVLLWLLMRYVLLAPVARVMDEREERLRESRAEADSASSGAEDAVAAYKAQVNVARAEATGIVTAAREEAERYRATQLAEANAAIHEQREQAAAEVTAAKAAALAQLRTQIAGIAVTAASRAVQKDLVLDAQLQVIEDYVNGVNKGGSR